MSDDRLALAIRAVRRVSRDTPSDPRATRARILAATGGRRERYRFFAAAAAVLLALLVGPTAWALGTGRVARWVRSAVGQASSRRSNDERPLARVTRSAPGVFAHGLPASASGAVAAPASVLRGETIMPTPAIVALQPTRTETEIHAQPVREAAHSLARVHAANPRAQHDSNEPPRDEDPSESLYAVAHRAHFVSRDPAAALQAWDAYLLAAPAGRYAPEARYNRALDLLRLGRVEQAISALDPFAHGALGGYRQAEAQRLIEAYGPQPTSR